MFIEKLRQKAQSKLVTVIMGVVALSFALFGVQNYFIGRSHNPIVAKVGDFEITAATLGQATQSLINNIAFHTHKRPDPKTTEYVKQLALKQLIDKYAMIDTAYKLGFYADNALINQSILQDQTFQIDGQFNKDRYHQLISRAGMSESDFFDSLNDTLMMQQLQSSVLSTAFVMPSEFRQQAKLLHEMRDIAIITIPSSKAGKMTVTDEAIEDYYHAHSSDFMHPASAKFRYLLLDRNTIAQSIKLSNQEINDYYQNQSDHSLPLAKVRKKLETQLISQKSEAAFLALSDQLTDLAYGEGSSLTDTANELSLTLHTSGWMIDGGSTSRDNHKLFSKPNTIHAAFSDAVFKEGQNSGLVPVDENRVMVLRVFEKRDAKQKPLTEVKKLIKQRILADKQQAAVSSYANQQLGLIEELSGKKALQSFIRKHGLHIAYLSRMNREPSKRYSQQLQQTVFNHLQLISDGLSAQLIHDGSKLKIVVLLARHEGQASSKRQTNDEAAFHQQLADAEFSGVLKTLTSDITIK